METVRSIITEAIGYYANPSINYVTINSAELEDGVIVVTGDYDQDEDTIQVYFVISGKQDVEFGGDFFDLVHEIHKTYNHENIHREQWYAGEDTTRPQGESQSEYMLSRLEVEARARVDIPFDLEYYGRSEDLQEYLNYFHQGLSGSYDAIMFIEQATEMRNLKDRIGL